MFALKRKIMSWFNIRKKISNNAKENESKNPEQQSSENGRIMSNN